MCIHCGHEVVYRHWREGWVHKREFAYMCYPKGQGDTSAEPGYGVKVRKFNRG